MEMVGNRNGVIIEPTLFECESRQSATRTFYMYKVVDVQAYCTVRLLCYISVAS